MESPMIDRVTSVPHGMLPPSLPDLAHPLPPPPSPQPHLDEVFRHGVPNDPQGAPLDELEQVTGGHQQCPLNVSGSGELAGRLGEVEVGVWDHGRGVARQRCKCSIVCVQLCNVCACLHRCLGVVVGAKV